MPRCSTAHRRFAELACFRAVEDFTLSHSGVGKNHSLQVWKTDQNEASGMHCPRHYVQQLRLQAQATLRTAEPMLAHLADKHEVEKPQCQIYPMALWTASTFHGMRRG